MAAEQPRHKKHFILPYSAKRESFKPRVSGNGLEVPPQDRQAHGGALLRQVENLKPVLEQAKLLQLESGMEDGFGLQIEFESFPDVELAFESLELVRSRIELRNVRHEENRTLATVFVPDGKLSVLENKIIDYLEKTTSSGKPRNQKLIDTIRSIRVASIRSLWTDDFAVFPSDPDELFWWEVWLPVQSNRISVIEQFRQMASSLNFVVADGWLEFPERTVLQIYGSLEQMQRSMLTLNTIAELRRAKDTADFFDSLPSEEQSEWMADLLQRLRVSSETDAVPYICLLDTGVNFKHPLLAPAIRSADVHTVDPSWGVDDRAKHGTEMAGLAIFKDLALALGTPAPIDVTHRLESVKLLDRNHSNSRDPKHHGYLTVQAVSRPEITASKRQRVFSMAVTARDGRDRGRPSAWSATLDRLAVDYDNQGERPRLFIVSAGNIDDPAAWKEYPASNTLDGIHDPGQAWNVLTVGASTKLVNITEPDTDNFRPIAPDGGLSPFSTTSQTWSSHWPLKPDVVFEGGNVAIDAISAVWMPSLSLLTTSADFATRLFTTTRATSAASALAANMAAQLMATYPRLRLETIRGLIVHSAEWTPTMKQQFLTDPVNPTKRDVVILVRHCGFGQPDLARAIWSAENSLTLICEDKLQPFKRERGAEPTLRDMNLHQLPWPLAELESLGEIEVEMRVTLSYFIEPNPSDRGIKSRYRYESHGLRFDVKRPYESVDEFRSRINLAAREIEEGGRSSSNGEDPNWMLGIKNRHRGSIHTDIWKGPAAELASRGVLAVYPVTGWWKTRPKQELQPACAIFIANFNSRSGDRGRSLYGD